MNERRQRDRRPPAPAWTNEAVIVEVLLLVLSGMQVCELAIHSRARAVQSLLFSHCADREAAMPPAPIGRSSGSEWSIRHRAIGCVMVLLAIRPGETHAMSTSYLLKSADRDTEGPEVALRVVGSREPPARMVIQIAVSGPPRFRPRAALHVMHHGRTLGPRTAPPRSCMWTPSSSYGSGYERIGQDDRVRLGGVGLKHRPR